jgi:hypothetical protein
MPICLFRTSKIIHFFRSALTRASRHFEALFPAASPRSLRLYRRLSLWAFSYEVTQSHRHIVGRNISLAKQSQLAASKAAFSQMSFWHYPVVFRNAPPTTRKSGEILPKIKLANTDRYSNHLLNLIVAQMPHSIIMRLAVSSDETIRKVSARCRIIERCCSVWIANSDSGASSLCRIGRQTVEGIQNKIVVILCNHCGKSADGTGR